jgi:serine/threonine protein kinase
MNFNVSSRRKVGEAALQAIQTISAESKLTQVVEDKVHEISWHDVQTERTIGVGCFSRVYRVRLNCLELGSHANTRYALKCLNPKTTEKASSFRTGAIDLAVEGEILSRLKHKNVIRLHGITSGGPSKAYTEDERGYFLILDLLEEDTLRGRLEKYRREMNRSRSRRASMWTTSQSSVVERLQSTALGISEGMEYLHQNGVVLRDLKPDNIGFDENGGTPKIFDLGFAREAHMLQENEIAGSLRYMAPEVALGHGSTFASDIYSFGVILWELCTLQRAFQKHSSSSECFREKVIVGGWRPPVSSIKSAALRRLVEQCWDTNPEARPPSFSHIVKVLRVEIALDVSSSAKPLGSATSSASSLHRRATSLLRPADGSDKKASSSPTSLKRINSWAAKTLSGSSLKSFFSSSSSTIKRTEDTSLLCQQDDEISLISNHDPVCSPRTITIVRGEDPFTFRRLESCPSL